jgi:hypothetical protein
MYQYLQEEREEEAKTESEEGVRDGKDHKCELNSRGRASGVTGGEEKSAVIRNKVTQLKIKYLI